MEHNGYYKKELPQSSCTVTVETPIDVYGGNVALLATLSNASPNVLQKVTSALLIQADDDLRDIHYSKLTAFRNMKLANENMSTIAKEDVKSAIKTFPNQGYFRSKNYYNSSFYSFQ